MNLPVLIYLIGSSIVGVIALTALFPSLATLTLLFIGPAVGLIVVTQLNFILALVFGFNPLTIVFGIMFCATGLFFFGKNNFTIIKNRLQQIPKITIRNALRRHAFLLLGVLIFGSYVVFILSTKVLSVQNGNLVTGGGGLWADTALHSAYTMSLVEQTLPPQNPLFAGRDLVYPFMVNFVSASFIKLGSNLRFSFIVPQFFYFIAFVGLFFLLSEKTIGKRTGLIALSIFLLGWGLGFVEYIKDFFVSGNLFPIREYTNNLPGFYFHNALTGLIFPERSFLPGLVIGLLISLLFLDPRLRGDDTKTLVTSLSFPPTSLSFPRKRESILIGIFLGLLPLWHTHTFIYFSVFLTVSFLSELILNRRNPKYLKEIVTRGVFIGFTALVVSLPSLTWIGSHIERSFLTTTLGWIAQEGNQLRFWLLNAGVVLPLAAIGFFQVSKLTRGLVIPAVGVFILTNFVLFSPWSWDNIKLITWAFLFFSLSAGTVIDQLFNRNLLFKSAALILFLIAITSGLLSQINLSQTTHTLYDVDDQELAQWVTQNTTHTAVFAIDPWPNHPLPGLTGRTAYLGYPGQLWVHGIDYNEREQQVRALLTGNLNVIKEMQPQPDYVIVVRDQKNQFTSLDLVYENPKFAVFKL